LISILTYDAIKRKVGSVTIFFRLVIFLVGELASCSVNYFSVYLSESQWNHSACTTKCTFVLSFWASPKNRQWFNFL